MPGPIMIDVEGLSLEPRDREVLEHPLTGGVILFARNYSSRTQVKALIEEIRHIAPKLIIAVDQEGGRVQRFRDEFTRIPPMRIFGQLYAQSPHAAVQRAEDCGWVLGSELREVGVDLNFAPVVDLDYGMSDVIGDRAFSSNADAVIELAAALMGGLHSAGISSCIKHFPGHGFVAADSHLELPVDNRNRAELDVDLKPFKKLLSARSVMTAHLVASCEDNELVSFSKRWVSDILRRDLGYKGVIFSDDLSMKGADCDGGIHAKVERALAAGCEFLPVCNDREAVLELYDGVSELNGSPRISSLLATSMPAHYKTTKRYAAFQEFLSTTDQDQHGG
ncbi:MAG: beta-N-acetylhexosaminidase [Gammaproteobacteria bacterium]